MTDASEGIDLDELRENLARTLFIASDDFAFADRMSRAWDAPGSVGRARWYRYADAILGSGWLAEHDAALIEGLADEIEFLDLPPTERVNAEATAEVWLRGQAQARREQA